MVLVVGATGMLGLDVCRRLREAGHPVRALVRERSDPGKVDRLEQWGGNRFAETSRTRTP